MTESENKRLVDRERMGDAAKAESNEPKIAREIKEDELKKAAGRQPAAQIEENPGPELLFICDYPPFPFTSVEVAEKPGPVWQDPEGRFAIIKHICTLGYTSGNCTKELNLVSWSNRPPKYDIWEWAAKYEEPHQGVTLSEEEAYALYIILLRKFRYLCTTSMQD